MLLELLLVISVIDGDTVKVLDKNNNKQITVRLASIDAPERKQPFGTKSKRMLANLIGNKRVDLDCPKKDRYQRQICTITLNGVDINLKMVAKGGAWVYRQYYSGVNYIAVENFAKKNKIGLWHTSEYAAVPPWKWRKNKKNR